MFSYLIGAIIWAVVDEYAFKYNFIFGWTSFFSKLFVVHLVQFNIQEISFSKYPPPTQIESNIILLMRHAVSFSFFVMQSHILLNWYLIIIALLFCCDETRILENHASNIVNFIDVDRLCHLLPRMKQVYQKSQLAGNAFLTRAKYHIERKCSIPMFKLFRSLLSIIISCIAIISNQFLNLLEKIFDTFIESSNDSNSP